MAALLERERELELVEQALHASIDGVGATLAIQGPPGIGKTVLVGAAIERARAAGVRVLTARGSELETSFAHGIVRQLFELAVAEATPRERKRLLAGAAAGTVDIVDPRATPRQRGIDPTALPHAVYWLAANVAADRPLMLAIDDAHWCDPASLACIVYLARRIEGLPIVLVIARRGVEPGAETSILDRLRSLATTRTIEPGVLGEVSVHALAPLRSRELARAVHSSTGGNPLYVVELLRAIEAARPADELRAAGELGPRSVAEITLARIARTPEAARRVAQAIAILEPHAGLAHVAAVAGVDLDTATHAADELFALGMLATVAPCRFAHPIVRAAIEDDLPPARRGRDHARAAQLLRDAGASPQTIATHLMRSTPAGDRETVVTLQRAADAAIARGAPAEATAYLSRALAEEPDRAARFAVVLALGLAEAMQQRPECIAHLREAYALASDPESATRAAVALGQALTFAGQLDAAFAFLAGVERRGDSALELDALVLNLALPVGAIRETEPIAARLRGELAPTSPGACRVLGSIAFRALISCEPRSDVLALLDSSLFEGKLTLEFGHDGVALALIWLDELDRADALLGQAIDAALAIDSLGVVSAFSTSRAYGALRRGDLRRVDADVDRALAAAGDEPSFAQLAALIATSHALVERGESRAALELVRTAAIPPAIARMSVVSLIRHAEGRALIAERRHEEAVRVLEVAGATFERAGVISPTVASWRSDLALAHAGCGRRDVALALATTELELAERSEIPRARAIALRALGLIEGGERGIALLGEAVELLAAGPGRLELARTLCELGAALRRANQRREGRARLEAALDLAVGCGARALADRAWDELRASGAKPRRPAFSGLDALTGAELRACQLAATGLSNAEIAQSLVVTKKTVEAHLGSAYRKLEIDGREQLARTLQKMPGPGVKMPSGS